MVDSVRWVFPRWIVQAAAKRAYRLLEQILGRMDLRLNEQKTHIVDLPGKGRIRLPRCSLPQDGTISMAWGIVSSDVASEEGHEGAKGQGASPDE